MKYTPIDQKIISNFQKKYKVFCYSLIVFTGIFGVLLCICFNKPSIDDPVLSMVGKLACGLGFMLIPSIFLKEPEKMPDTKVIYFKPSRTIRIIEEDATHYNLYYRRFNSWIFNTSIIVSDPVTKDEKIAEMKIAYKEKYFSKSVAEKKKIYWSGKI